MAHRYRLYFDESGDHTYTNLDAPRRRFLALCGVIFRDDNYRTFQQRVGMLKEKHLDVDPDEPIILHREHIINRRGPFKILQDSERRRVFDEDVLKMISDAEFVGIIVVLDKKRHLEHYVSPANPYNYCLVALLQRYCHWLGSRQGDVMGESRGGTEDRQLQAAYESIYQGGDWIQTSRFYQSRLTSRQLKLKPKEKNVVGLQLADLIAHPAKVRAVNRNTAEEVPEGGFGRLIADAFWEKMRKKPSTGDTRGYGEVYIE